MAPCSATSRTMLLGLSLTVLSACNTDRLGFAPEEEARSNAAPLQAYLGGPEFVPNEMLVHFKPGATSAARSRALARVNGSVAERIVTAAMRSSGDQEGVTLVRTPMAAMQAIAAIKGDEAIEYAEPNWVYQHQSSNDQYYSNGSLWGMYSGSTSPSNQFGSGAAAAWARGTSCNGVWVGVIDEGYFFNHADLAANIGKNPGEIEGNLTDDDGNGLVDDVYGWDFATNDRTVFDGTGDDHGTHVAGTIGAVGNNRTGVVGVCQSGIKMLNAKFLGSQGGSLLNAIMAIDYFTDLKTRHNLNLVATNNSWGGGGFSQALQDAIERANGAGILFVAAAGNSTLNCETSTCYPAEYPNANVIAVASITSTGALSSFSNFGATTIDIGAPGSGIWSTVPGQDRKTKQFTSNYASYNGTSMATPHVTGAAALFATRNPGASAETIKNAILNSSTFTSSLNGRVGKNGRLNVSAF